MASPDEMLHEVGSFEPYQAKQVLDEFERQNIPFEIEADHSALRAPGRTAQMIFGMYPEGSKLVIFVPESVLPTAEAIVKKMFPE